MSYPNYQGDKPEAMGTGYEQWRQPGMPGGRGEYMSAEYSQYQGREAYWGGQPSYGQGYMGANWQGGYMGQDMSGYYPGFRGYEGKGRKPHMGAPQMMGHHHHHHHHQHQHSHKREDKDTINDYFSKRLLLKDFRKKEGEGSSYNDPEVQECVTEFVKFTMNVVEAAKKDEECDRAGFAQECEAFSQKWAKYSCWINSKLLRPYMDKLMDNKITWVGEEAPMRPMGGKKGEKGSKGEEGGKGGKGDRGDAGRGEFFGKGGKKGGSKGEKMVFVGDITIGVSGSKRQQARKNKELEKKKKEADKVRAEEEAKAAEEARIAQEQAAAEAAAQAEVEANSLTPKEAPIAPQEAEEPTPAEEEAEQPQGEEPQEE